MTFFKKHELFFDFLLVLLIGIEWKATRWEWQHPYLRNLYPFIFCFAWAALFIGLAKFLKKQVIRRQWKILVISLLCLPILLFPFTRWYETARFWVLKDQMEAVAIQYAEENREYIAEHGYAYVTIPSLKRYLSRVDGEITFRDENGMIKAVFRVVCAHIGPDWNLVYNTGIPSRYIRKYIFSSRWGTSFYLNRNWKWQCIPVEMKIKNKKLAEGDF